MDETINETPNAALGLAPTIHGRADPFHLRSSTWELGENVSHPFGKRTGSENDEGKA